MYIIFYKIMKMCKYFRNWKIMLKFLLGPMYADRGTKIIAVRDGQRNWKQVYASFVSKSIDKILLNFTNNILYNYF